MGDGSGNEIFAANTLAGDQDGGVGMGDSATILKTCCYGCGLADDTVLVLLDSELGIEGAHKRGTR